MTRPAPTLPKTLILSYLTTIGTPTRVRRAAAAGLYFLGTVHVSAGFVLATAVYFWISGLLDLGYPLTEIITDQSAPITAAALGVTITFIAGPLQLILARFVNRGNRSACLACLITILPLTFAIVVATALAGGAAIMLAFGLYGGRPDWPMLILLLPSAFGILLILVFKDLGAFLLWIARAPAVEKPSVPFLPAHAATPPTQAKP